MPRSQSSSGSESASNPTWSAEEFISEPVCPDPGWFDTRAMAAGLAGLPRGFIWRGRRYRIIEVLSEWKRSEAEHHRSGERYFRRHYYRVRVDEGRIMTLYVVRQVKSGENARRRWWLYSQETPQPAPESPGLSD